MLFFFGKLPIDTDGEGEGDEESHQVGDSLGRLEAGEAPQPGGDEHGGQEADALAAHRQECGLPGVSDGL